MRSACRASSPRRRPTILGSRASSSLVRTAETLGLLGTWVLDSRGSDSPWLPWRAGAAVPVPPGAPVTIRLADRSSIGWWFVDLADEGTSPGCAPSGSAGARWISHRSTPCSSNRFRPAAGSWPPGSSAPTGVAKASRTGASSCRRSSTVPVAGMTLPPRREATRPDGRVARSLVREAGLQAVLPRSGGRGGRLDGAEDRDLRLVGQHDPEDLLEGEGWTQAPQLSK